MRTLITLTTLCVLLFFVNVTPAHARLQPVGPGWEQGERLSKVSPELKKLVSLSRDIMSTIREEAMKTNPPDRKSTLIIELDFLNDISRKIVSQSPTAVRKEAQEYKKGVDEFIRQHQK